MIDYQNKLDKIKFVLENNDNTEFKIEQISVGQNDWTTLKNRTKVSKNDTTQLSDITKFDDVCEKAINLGGIDALKITLWQGGKGSKAEEHIIRITSDVYIPVLDDKKNSIEQIKQPMERAEERTDNIKELAKQLKESLSGFADNQSKEAQLALHAKFAELDHSFLIKEKEREIQNLRFEINGLNDEIDGLEDDIEAFEEKITELNGKLQVKESETNKLLNLGMLHLGGKVLNIPKEDIAGLQGLMMGQPIDENKQLSENAGGADENLSETDKKRITDIEVITSWLKTTDEENYTAACFVLKKCSENPELFKKIYELITAEEKEPESEIKTEPVKTD